MEAQGPPPMPERIVEVRLKDAQANSQQFTRSLPDLARVVDAESPGTQSGRLTVVWDWVKWCVPKVWTAGTRTVEWGISRFTDVETRRIREEAAAYKTRKDTDSDALLKQAQADLLKAEAAVKIAQGLAIAEQQAAVAEESRAQTRRKDEIYQKLLARSFDWKVELDENGELLKVFVTKRRPSLDGPHRGTDPELSDNYNQ
jgi:hypothetical protein